jgi:hypothetical protein
MNWGSQMRPSHCLHTPQHLTRVLMGRLANVSSIISFGKQVMHFLILASSTTVSGEAISGKHSITRQSYKPSLQTATL